MKWDNIQHKNATRSKSQSYRLWRGTAWKCQTSCTYVLKDHGLYKYTIRESITESQCLTHRYGTMNFWYVYVSYKELIKWT